MKNLNDVSRKDLQISPQHPKDSLICKAKAHFSLLRNHFQDNNYISKNYLSFLVTTSNNYNMWMNYDVSVRKNKKHSMDRREEIYAI